MAWLLLDDGDDRMTYPTASLDSLEGATILIDWAKAHNAVLGRYHREIAERHDVDVTGVVFSDIIP